MSLFERGEDDAGGLVVSVSCFIWAHLFILIDNSFIYTFNFFLIWIAPSDFLALLSLLILILVF